MLFDNARQAVLCVGFAASLLWLAIEYRENHQARFNREECPPALLEQADSAVPLSHNRGPIRACRHDCIFTTPPFIYAFRRRCDRCSFCCGQKPMVAT